MATFADFFTAGNVPEDVINALYDISPTERPFTGRIAHTLLELAKQPDAMTHPEGMQIRITRQEIAKIVGCSREMAGRVLKELEEQGLITAHGKTIVVFGTR